MYTIAAVLAIIACILLIMIILVQNPKGGGLASAFSASNQVMGVRKTADFLEKATWTLAIAILALSLVSSMSISRSETEEQVKSRLKDQINIDPSQTTDNFPVTAPPIEKPKPSNK
ncbi:MAG: preprotein translocase subunit SecG [Bacteroidia bacterium]|nr:preprotein translocase subunit SecG [Bacteroidia bacterium]